jgi:hypothetical protein
MAETRQHYFLEDNSVEAIQRIFNMLMDRLDELEGYRGTPTFRNDIDMTENRITNMADAIEGTDAITSGQADAAYAPLAHDHTGTGQTPVPEAGLNISDNTTGNVSTSAHGFCPKAPNDMSKFLRGDGAWAVPSLEAAWPVNSLFFAAVDTDPSTLLGFGTWANRGVFEAPITSSTYVTVYTWVRTA